jgi:hypothetical protein
VHCIQSHSDTCFCYIDSCLVVAERGDEQVRDLVDILLLGSTELDVLIYVIPFRHIKKSGKRNKISSKGSLVGATRLVSDFLFQKKSLVSDDMETLWEVDRRRSSAMLRV